MAPRYTIGPATKAMFSELTLAPGDLLRTAGLPEDLLLGPEVALTPEQLFRLWSAGEQLSGDPAFGARLAARTSAELFDPLIFAALCSPDLRHAAERISAYKRLLVPQRMAVETVAAQLRLTTTWSSRWEPPASFVAYELAFLVALARLGTRARVCPAAITVPEPPRDESARAYEEFLGVPIRKGATMSVTFSAADARRPFLTANAAMWKAFEPELRRRLADLEEGESTTERVRATLHELLPAGHGTATAVSRRLAVGGRTLQRRLAEEGTTFQAVLDETRSALARHYLARPGATIAEISFLLGYDDPGSFHRAFHRWTGTTPRAAGSGSGQLGPAVAAKA
jgi:AraC-like DNA-binding protein